MSLRRVTFVLCAAFSFLCSFISSGMKAFCVHRDSIRRAYDFIRIEFGGCCFYWQIIVDRLTTRFTVAFVWNLCLFIQWPNWRKHTQWTIHLKNDDESVVTCFAARITPKYFTNEGAKTIAIVNNRSCVVISWKYYINDIKTEIKPTSLKQLQQIATWNMINYCWVHSIILTQSIN